MEVAVLFHPQPNVEGAHRWYYVYDRLQRVTYACSDWENDACTSSGHEFFYEYDGAGNATRFDRWNATTYHVEAMIYTYNEANQIAAACLDLDRSEACDGSETPVSYVYDAYGNLTYDGDTDYTYDAANRLTSVTTGTNVTSYAYDGDGNRISQTVGTTTTTYVIDTATPLTMVLSETTDGQTIYFCPTFFIRCSTPEPHAAELCRPLNIQTRFRLHFSPNVWYNRTYILLTCPLLGHPAHKCAPSIRAIRGLNSR